MSLRRPLCLLAILATGLPMLASDGYFALGYGTASKGMGGAGVALPLDSLSAASNPAAMAFVGNQFDLGLSWFNPNRDYEVKGNPTHAPGTFGLAAGKVKSGSKSFLVPSLGMNWQLTPKSAFGVAIYGNGGMNTDYSASTFYGGATGVNLSQLFIAPTYAYKLTEQHSVGVSAVLAYQQFEAKGLGSFAPYSADSANLSNRGEDTSTGYGLRVGYLGQFSPQFSLGASYQTRTRMGELKKYAGLFAEQGGFDIPSNYTIGLAYHPTEALTFALDVERINYSEVKSIGNPMLPNLQPGTLGNTNGAGFGWKDINVYKLGVQWQATQDLMLRAGYNHCDQPVPSSEVLFNILAPGIIEDQVTIGATKTISPKSAVSGSIVRAFSKSVTGPNPLEVPGVQTVTLRMDQWDVEIGYSYKF